jgi:hypothetical protein
MVSRRPRPTAKVLGEAFVRLLEAYPVDRVPTSGGLNATVVVTVPVTALVDGESAGQAPGTLPGTGVQVAPSTARRLACAAGVLPAVLDGNGRVLDLGRRSRLATPAQRLALYVQQHGVCAIQGCDRPASWGDAHHWKRRWTDGATTNLDDLILICARHHTLAHKPGATVQPADHPPHDPVLGAHPPHGRTYRIHHQT